MRLRMQRVIVASGIVSLFLGASAWRSRAEAAGVQVRFGLESPATGSFPSDLFTWEDSFTDYS